VSSFIFLATTGDLTQRRNNPLKLSIKSAVTSNDKGNLTRILTPCFLCSKLCCFLLHLTFEPNFLIYEFFNKTWTNVDSQDRQYCPICSSNFGILAGGPEVKVSEAERRIVVPNSLGGSIIGKEVSITSGRTNTLAVDGLQCLLYERNW
jgi:hypothetical protein